MIHVVVGGEPRCLALQDLVGAESDETQFNEYLDLARWRNGAVCFNRVKSTFKVLEGVFSRITLRSPKSMNKLFIVECEDIVQTDRCDISREQWY